MDWKARAKQNIKNHDNEYILQKKILLNCFVTEISHFSFFAQFCWILRWMESQRRPKTVPSFTETKCARVIIVKLQQKSSLITRQFLYKYLYANFTCSCCFLLMLRTSLALISGLKVYFFIIFVWRIAEKSKNWEILIVQARGKRWKSENLRNFYILW